MRRRLLKLGISTVVFYYILLIPFLSTRAELALLAIPMLAVTIWYYKRQLIQRPETPAILFILPPAGVYTISLLLVWRLGPAAIVILFPCWLVVLDITSVELFDTARWFLKQSFGALYPLTALLVVIIICVFADVVMARKPQYMWSAAPLLGTVLIAMILAHKKKVVIWDINSEDFNIDKEAMLSAARWFAKQSFGVLYPLTALLVVIIVCVFADVFMARKPKFIWATTPLLGIILIALKMVHKKKVEV